MPGAKEIKNRINSIEETRKITNAMYLIASNKLRKAEQELKKTRPYFDAIQNEIQMILCAESEIKSPYLYHAREELSQAGNYAYLVITADKGLAGAYNHNVLKKTVQLMEKHAGHNDELYVVGEYGRNYFTVHGTEIQKSFLYTAQNPTVARAREICYTLLDGYEQKRISQVYIIYTDFKSSVDTSVIVTRLLPFHRDRFVNEEMTENENEVEFEPSADRVLNNIVPGYITGFIYSALVDSFCSEQNARMTAMDSANKNADDILTNLSTEYNRARQSGITQEITEVSSGARCREGKFNKGE